MKLRTSFFNLTVLRKDITRFSPLWGLYTVFMLIYLLLIWATGDTAQDRLVELHYLMNGMAWVNFFYAGVAALLLYGDLFKGRLCNALHAMPLRREGWFFTHLAAGMLIGFLPNLLGAAIGACLLGQYAYGAALWLGLMVLEYTVFFGIGIFCVMCAGTKLGAAAIYALVNFLPMLAAWLVSTFYEPLLYGITVDIAAISRLSPVVLLSDTPFLEANDFAHYSDQFLVDIPGESWLVLGICSLAGILFMAVSLLLYRKRDLEHAGDFVCFKPAGPVFLVLYTLCFAGLVFFIAYDITSSLGYVFLAIGLAVGFFTGIMLLEKRVNVFRGKTFLSFGIFLAVFALSMVLTFVDPLGVTKYVPKASDVKTVRISPYANHYYLDRESCSLKDQQDIEAVIGVHKEALSLRLGFYDVEESVSIRYTLKDGRTVTRTYSLPEDCASCDVLKKIYSRPEYVLDNHKPDFLLKRMYLMEFFPYEDELPYLHIGKADLAEDFTEKFDRETCLTYTVDGAFADDPRATGLLDAILADCQAGNLAQYGNNDEAIGYVVLEWMNGRSMGHSITVYENCENIIAYLKGLNGQ